ncbi:MAG: radical SAM protein, partial [Spirosomataceae bacterium]
MPAFHWNDTKQFIRTIRFSKVWNAFQVVGSYVISKLLKRPIQPGLPLAISIEPTTSCNLRCPECPSGLRSFTRPTGMLNEAIFLKTIDELQHSLFYLTFYFQGEPYLHPNFLEMVSYANQKGIYTATSTNAHFFTDSIAKQTVESGL